MKKIKFILEKFELLIYFLVAPFVISLHFSVSYNFLFFLLDFFLALSILADLFFIEKIEKYPSLGIEKFDAIQARILGIIEIIILAKYTDIFENIFSAVFE